MVIGEHLVKGWSKIKSLVALSSAESELYATLKTSSETFGLISMARVWGTNSRGSSWEMRARRWALSTAKGWANPAHRYELCMGTGSRSPRRRRPNAEPQENQDAVQKINRLRWMDGSVAHQSNVIFARCARATAKAKRNAKCPLSITSSRSEFRVD